MINHKINEEIKNISQVVLLIKADGEKLGNVSVVRALEIAYNDNLDLVCMNETSNPPVCKIMDYHKFKYDQTKREKDNKAKQKEIEVKEIQLRPQIDKHDLETKAKKCKEELLKGNKIRIVLSFRGRQLEHPEIGFDLVNQFVDIVKDDSVVMKVPTLDGRRIECILNPKKK